jgi:glycosyltransferase involved in cell wall biosynthesis
MSLVATKPKTASLVSCVIPTHNRVMMLDRAMASVMAQTYPHIELIVVDDASSDGTDQLCWDWIRRDHRVRFVRNERPLGGGAARNAGINAARGEFIAFLDDDDEWLPERLSRQMRALKESRQSFAFSDYHLRGGDRDSLRACSDNTVTLDRLLWGNCIGSTSSVIVDAEIARTVQFDPELTAAQDYDFYIRVLERGVTAVHVPFPDVSVNEHQGSRISTSGRDKYEGNRRCLLKHFHRFSREQRLFHLFKYRLLEYSCNPRRNTRYLRKALGAYSWWRSRGDFLRVVIAVRSHYRLVRDRLQ